MNNECESMTTLKPCPFCGGRAEFSKNSNSSSGGERGWAFGIRCKKCGIETAKRSYVLKVNLGSDGEIRVTEDERGLAAAAWNGRDGESNDYPAVVAVPAVHGRWVGTADGYADGELVYDMWECSECGYDADGADEKPSWNYCPNCGAKMDGGR